MSIFIKGLNRLIKGMKMPKLEKTYKVRLYKAVNGSIIVTACGIKDNLLQPVGEVIEVQPHGRLGDLDELKKKVLKWLPSDPCGQEEKEFPFETDICASMLMEIEEAETIIEAEGEK